jgi:hypothetical protein
LANFWPGGIGVQDFVQFNTAGYDPATGQLSWDSDFTTLQVGINGVVLQVGQEHLVKAKNSSDTTAIPDGTAVMFTGSTGDVIAVAPAISDGTYDGHLIVGVTTEEIPADGFGFVTQFGLVNGIKTDYPGWVVGDLLYTDPVTPGALTNILPVNPAWHFPIAAVTRINANSGRIFVRAIPEPKDHATWSFTH